MDDPLQPHHHDEEENDQTQYNNDTALHQDGIQFDEEDDVPPVVSPFINPTDHHDTVDLPTTQQQHITPNSEDHVMQNHEGEEDFLLNVDVVRDSSSRGRNGKKPASASTSDEEVYTFDDHHGKDYVLKSIKTSERKKKNKSKSIKIHKILWKRNHEARYPQIHSTDGVENKSVFVYLIMSEIATESDIIGITEQFGPILIGLDIRNCNLLKKAKAQPQVKKRKVKKEEDDNEESGEKEDFSHPVLQSIASNCPNLEILKIDGNNFDSEHVAASKLFENCLKLRTYYGPLSFSCLDPKNKSILSKLQKMKLELDSLPITLARAVVKNTMRGPKIVKINKETSIPYKAFQEFGEYVHKLVIDTAKYSGSKEKLPKILKNTFPELEELHIANESTIDSADLKLIGKLTQLTVLNFTHFDTVTDHSLAAIFQKCTLLRKIILDNCWQISDEAFTHLKHLPNLQYLDISNIRVTNSTLKTIANSISSGDLFTHFISENNYNATDEGLKILLEKFPSIQCLNINNWGKLTDTTLENIGVYLKQPKHLGLMQGSKTKPRYTSNGLRKALQSKTIETLTIHYVENINDAMIALSELCPNLKRFGMRGNEHITDDALEVMCDGCIQLEILDISQCSLLTDEALNAVSNSLKSLLQINISYCDEMTCDGIEVMLDACSHVTHVHIKPDFPYIEQARILFNEHSIRYSQEVSIHFSKLQ
ncbi:hypothetical protein C9374_005676 [Naegleria lovaniensis]|uniref:F-box/LRR-repeat protein 15-like leucin rich repeat domain-containing protein n=1 Tax=Naegleria lovaniensis TaxID=51637 RepID=A0AA88GJ22_NAELO|nr:uncharacterized protein C9374_005676 [Naegleria lovaniensis]KAG2381884.1 hypothetical protein C9374_005676 [Naegleria lovaniensis]